MPCIQRKLIQRRLEQLPLLLQGSRGRGIKKVAPNVPEIMKRKRYGQLAAEAREQIDVARQENKYKASREKAVCEEKKADEPVLASGKESKCDDDKADEQKGLMAERNPLEVEDTDTRSAREVASVDRYEDKTPEKQPGGEEEHEDAPAVALARQQKQHLGGGGGDGASDEEGNDGSLATEDTGVRSRGEQATVDKHKNEEMEKQPREKETGEDTPAVTTVEQEKDDLGDGRGVGGSEEEEEGNDETAQQEDIEGIEQEGSLKEDETDRLKPTGADVKAEEEGSDEAAHQEELKATELDGRLEKDETGRSKSTGGDVKSEVGEGSDAIGDWADASGITTPQFLTIGRETDSQHEVGVDSSSIFEEYPEYPESSVDAMQQEQIATATCDEDSGADSDGSGCTSEFYSSSWLERRV